MMSRIQRAGLTAAMITAAFTATAMAQPTPPPAAAPAPPLFSTTKVDGTDGVYVFRYQGHQALFVVTPEGVIATDPIGERRPQAVTTYIAEIRKITQAPIRYVIYSHSHYDHIAGGKPFKDAGAIFVAHENAKTLLTARKNPDIVIPDETVATTRTITLGGTSVELNWVGKNHGLDTLIIRLPREKIIFTVDWIPINGIQFRGMADTYIPDIEDRSRRWCDGLGPHDPRHPARRPAGTKDAARPSAIPGGPLGRGEEDGRRGQVLSRGHDRHQAAEIQSWPNYNAFRA